MANTENTSPTPNQIRTQAARRAMRIKAAQRNAEKYREALELIGYTVIPPQQ